MRSSKTLFQKMWNEPFPGLLTAFVFILLGIGMIASGLGDRDHRLRIEALEEQIKELKR